ncbi:MAG: DedA family protein [Candidatus Aegiribacteria sp.]|nr:DedA family protein [Candidatus Aegiribacteria sp.]
MIEGILEYLANNPPGAWAGPLLGVIAFAETLFPPIPGDIIFIVMSGWAVSGGLTIIMTTIYGVTGCFLASCVLFYVGHKPGRQFVEGWLKRKVEPERVDRAKSLIADRGPLILAVSRFIPGVRSLLVFMAGSSGMKFTLAAIPLAFSAAAWYLLLSIAGSIFRSNIQAAEGFMKHFEIWLWIILAVVFLVFLVKRIRIRKARR